MNEPAKHDEPSPTKSFTLKPDGRVQTNWAVIGSIIIATAVLVGGLQSVKGDIADAARDAAEARQMTKEIRDDLLRLRIALGVFDVPSASVKTVPKETHP